MHIFKLLALAALPLLATPAAAQEADLRDLTVEQASVAHIRAPRPGSLRVSLQVDRPDTTYAVGEAVKFLLTTNEDAYVTILGIGPTGRVAQLFPNRYQADNRVFAHRSVEIGGDNSGAAIRASGPVGVELVKVIAARRPINVVSDARLQGDGAFRVMEGGIRTLLPLLRDLEVVADQDDSRIAVLNVVLRTIGSRGVRTSMSIIPPGRPWTSGSHTPWAAPASRPVETGTAQL